MQIQGITAFVTGTASGLGAATLRHLAERGARVALFDLPGSAGAELAREIGSAARFTSGDGCDEAQVGAALDEAADTFGPIRALINGAGIARAQRSIDRDGAPFRSTRPSAPSR
jgi:NAD(P)-dependent dehydrogenase (short-subunit alcohol dehydrogenase family)